MCDSILCDNLPQHGQLRDAINSSLPIPSALLVIYLPTLLYPRLSSVMALRTLYQCARQSTSRNKLPQYSESVDVYRSVSRLGDVFVCVAFLPSKPSPGRQFVRRSLVGSARPRATRPSHAPPALPLSPTHTRSSRTHGSPSVQGVTGRVSSSSSRPELATPLEPKHRKLQSFQAVMARSQC